MTMFHIEANAAAVDWNNFLWIFVYAIMSWVCWFEEYYFLTEWDDAGAFFYRCYGSW